MKKKEQRINEIMALIREQPTITVKMLAEILKQNFADIVPAYHMNKLHWISLRVEGDLPEEEWEKLIRLSYTLTLPTCRRAKS